MATYKDWNDEIFKYFFNFENVYDINFFCVNKEVINYIGEKLNLDQDSESDFCCCVLEHLLKKNSTGAYQLEHNIKFSIIDNIPQCTAILAFFIYVASRMGEKPEIQKNVYWEIFNTIIHHYYQSFEEKLRTKNVYDCYFDLFHQFETFISEKNNINFKFQALYNRRGRDFIGLPIFQSMISTSDRCILSKKFYECKNKYSSIAPYYNEIMNDSKYSNIFRKLRDSIEYKQDLLNRIKEMADNWDGIVYEYDMTSKQKRCSVIPMLYQYSLNSDDELKFYITTPNMQNLESLSFENYTIDTVKKRVRINEAGVTLNQVAYPIKEQGKLKISRTKSEYIIFKKDADTNSFIEISGNAKVKIGDDFSILAPQSFFADDNNLAEIQNIAEYTDASLDFELTDDGELYLLHNLHAIDYDNKFVYPSKKDTIAFEYGLKSGYGINSYIKGAEPIVKIKDIEFVKIDDEFINNDAIAFQNNGYKVDLRKYYNTCGEHKLVSEKLNASWHYDICPITALETDKSPEYIYNEITNSVLKTKYPNMENKIISGAYLENIADIITRNSASNQYILSILKMHRNEEKFPIPQALLQKLLNFKHNTKIVEYLNDNKYIDNFITRYLNELKEA